MAGRSIGPRFVEAVAAQDASAIAACLAPRVEFRALIPPGLRERTGAEDAAALVAGWFSDSTELDLIESRAEEVADRLHLAYRFEGIEDGDPRLSPSRSRVSTQARRTAWARRGGSRAQAAGTTA